MTPKPTAKRGGPGVIPDGPGHEDAPHVHFDEATGHTYRVHAGTRRQALEDRLAKLKATGPPVFKNLMTVQTLVEFLGPNAAPDSRATLFALLTPAAAKHNWDLVRGSIAVCVEMLRYAHMGDIQIKQWLDEQFRKRDLGLTGVEAVQLYNECRRRKPSISKTTVKIFTEFRPVQLTSLTEDVAKERVAEILGRAVLMKAGRPLTRSRR